MSEINSKEGAGGDIPALHGAGSFWAGCISPVAGTHGRNARYSAQVSSAGGRGPPAVT